MIAQKVDKPHPIRNHRDLSAIAKGHTKMDRLLVNANIYTLDETAPRATSIAIRDGRIIAVGDDSLRSLATSGTQLDDLHGATVIPGLVDAHLHWAWTARGLREIDLFDVPSVTEAVRRVAVAASEPGDWLRGQGWAQSLWPGEAFPTAADLDAVVPDRPVLLNARSGHAAWVNSVALRMAGITDSTPDPKGGVIQRDTAGHVTGILFEEAIKLVSTAVPVESAAELANLMEQAQTLAWKLGLTGIHDYDGPDAFEAEQILHEQGRLGLRIVKNINDPYIKHAFALKLRWGFGNDWLRLGGLKIFADGALGTRTALMIEPYEGEPDNRGVVVTDKEDI
jgi:predicted amidohydrolase YtcJ